MRKIMMFAAALLCLLAVPAAASALTFESAPGTPLMPADSAVDPLVMPPDFVPTDLTSGDFNKDGYDDIAVVTDSQYIEVESGQELDPISKNIYVYLGSSTGALTPADSNPIGSNSTVERGRIMIRAIDVDGDSDLDLVAGSPGSSPKIETYKNGFNGENESFGTVPSSTLEIGDSESVAGYTSISTGDKDGDGDVDLVLGLYNHSYALIRNRAESHSDLDMPNGITVVPRSNPNSFDGIHSTAMGNFGDNAGVPESGDLVMISSHWYSSTDPQPNRLLYVKSAGPSSFEETPTVVAETETDGYFGWVKSADLNGDSYDDIVFQQNKSDGSQIVRTALGGPTGPVAQSGDGSSLDVYGAQQAAPGDYNADGDGDVAIPQFVDAGFQLALGDGSGKLALFQSGQFALPALGSKDFYPQSTASLDANGDGRLDFAAASGNSGSDSQGSGVAVMLNKAAPGISVDKTEIDFGTVPFDAELIAPVPIKIKSTGDMPVNLGQIVVDGGSTPERFSIDRGDCPTGDLAPGVTCTIEVTMSQTIPGYTDGWLHITNSATDDSIGVQLYGQVEEPDPTSKFLSLRVKSAKKVKAGKQLVVTAMIRNSGDYRSAKFNLRASAPKKLTGQIRFTPLRNLSISERHSSTIKFKVPVKRKAKGKFQVKVSLVASDRKIERKTAKVKIVKKKRNR